MLKPKLLPLLLIFTIIHDSCGGSKGHKDYCHSQSYIYIPQKKHLKEAALAQPCGKIRNGLVLADLLEHKEKHELFNNIAI